MALTSLSSRTRGAGCAASSVRQASVATPARLRQQQQQREVVARAANSSSSSFWPGVIVGGLVCGTLGFLLAPQISKALLGDDQRLKLPGFMEGDELPRDPEATKRELDEKIAQLNASIDEVAAKLPVDKAMDAAQVEVAV